MTSQTTISADLIPSYSIRDGHVLIAVRSPIPWDLRIEPLAPVRLPPPRVPPPEPPPEPQSQPTECTPTGQPNQSAQARWTGGAYTVPAYFTRGEWRFESLGGALVSMTIVEVCIKGAACSRGSARSGG